MHDNTQEQFLELVRSGLFPGKAAKILVHGTAVDWDEIYRLAEEQSVVGLVAAGMESLPSSERPPQAVVLQFVGRALQLEQRNQAMNEFIARLISDLRKSDVYTLLVKGQGIAQCYEKPLWRACGDVDLYLSRDNYVTAQKVLIPMASQIDEEDTQKEHLGMTIDTWVVELHGSLHSDFSSRVNKGLDEVHKSVFYNGDIRSWDNSGVTVFLPSANNDVIIIFAHILQHFFGGGIGLRQICDWCRLLWTYDSDLDRKLLEKRLVAMKLMSEWKAFAALAVNTLGMPEEKMPFYSPDNKWKSKAEKILSLILETGNFGHSRDMSYISSKPYLLRKAISLCRGTKDGWRQMMIFPMDSMRAWCAKMARGIKTTLRRK